MKNIFIENYFREYPDKLFVQKSNNHRGIKIQVENHENTVMNMLKVLNGKRFILII